MNSESEILLSSVQEPQSQQFYFDLRGACGANVNNNVVATKMYNSIHICSSCEV
jgi:hypothetical protein